MAYRVILNIAIFMDKFVTRHPNRPNTGENDGTPTRKRGHEESDSHGTAKKSRNLDDTLLNSNFYSPLTNNDNGDTISSNIKNVRSRKPHIPPITLHQKLVNPKSTYEKIQSWAKEPVYFKQSGDVRHIYATDKEDFIRIKEQLKLINFLWTSHRAEDETYRKLILKGIDKSYTEQEVYDDIKIQFNAVAKVKQLSKAGEDGQHSPIGVYIVYFDWNTILSVPQKIVKYCCYHKVSWEHMHKKKNNLKQCYNCQRFGHHSSECGLQNRCVKCVEHHSHGECKKIKGTDVPVCCNCGKNHPANYRGCIKAQEYLKNNSKPTNGQQSRTKYEKRAKQVNGVGYSHQARRVITFGDTQKKSEQPKTPKQGTVGGSSGLPGNNQRSRGPTGVSSSASHNTDDFSGSQGFSFITNEIKSVFGVPFSVIMKTVNEFMPVYRACTNQDTRKLLLIEFMCKISP